MSTNCLCNVIIFVTIGIVRWMGALYFLLNYLFLQKQPTEVLLPRYHSIVPAPAKLSLELVLFDFKIKTLHLLAFSCCFSDLSCSFHSALLGRK